MRFASIVLLLLCCAARANGEDPPTRLPSFVVLADSIGSREVSVPRDDLKPPAANFGAELLAVPGVYGQSRAADAVEPNLRGLGLDRVATTLDGIPLVNASPERTHSPIVILGPAAVAEITVAKALPSVTLGPVPTGGRIALTTTAHSAAESAACVGSVTTAYDGGRNGWSSHGLIAAGPPKSRVQATFFRNDLGDYRAADGRVVAATLDDMGCSVAIDRNLAHQRLHFEYLHRRLRKQETLSLPLDGKNTDADALLFAGRWAADTQALSSVEYRIGGSFTDPFITSEDRIAPAVTYARATARTFGSGLTTRWRTPCDDTIAVGADYAWQRRRAVRATTAGKDYIWPNAHYGDVGVFAEWQRAVGPTWRTRAGTRLDAVRSDADDADKPALGRPLRDQFVQYNGPAAARTDKHDVIGAANLLLESPSSAMLSAYVGAGLSAQTAGVMERYRAFLNALGGDGHGGNAVELGNPALGTERKLATESGIRWRSRWVDVAGTAYWYHVDGFILRVPLGTTAAPLARMVVFGYRNTPVELTGGEFGLTLKPVSQWQFPVTFATARGHNTATGVGLAELPPWETTSALRFRGNIGARSMAFQIGQRYVARRTNPNPSENPLFATSGGFSVWHVRAAVPLTAHITGEAGIENALARRYSEYLTPPVSPFRPASGDLQPGDRVPAAGRSAWLAVTLNW